MERQQALNSIRALESWAKNVTNGYRDVDVRDMTISFRDGLAFCAIIHHFRPDLINYESLSKENILQNNSLAFSVAEKQLGVPALLDAEDMVKYSRPDRLSIITYLSQLHNCFVNQNKVNSRKAAVKRLPSNNSTGPPTKVVVVKPMNVPLARHEVCTACSHRVFILERLIVDGKLYHRTCFRCSKCKCLLNPGTYIEGDTPGAYECSVCPVEDNSNTPDVNDFHSNNSIEGKLQDSVTDRKTTLITVPSPSPSSIRVSSARNSFLKQSLLPNEKKENTSLENNTKISKNDSIVGVKCNENELSVKDKISAFETNRMTTSFTMPQLIPKQDIIVDTSISSKPSARRSLLSAESLHHGTTLNTVADKSSVETSTSTVDANDIKTFSKSMNSLSTNITSVTKNSDSLHESPSLANEASSLSSALSSPIEPEKSKPIYDRQRFQIRDYKSPLIASRDIFKTNFPPLRLNIDSINKKDTATSSLVSDSAKTTGFSTPQIRPMSYSVTLQRPVSTENVSKLEPSESVSANANSSDVLHSKWGRTIPRKSSLDSSTQALKSVHGDDSRYFTEISNITKAECPSDNLVKTDISTLSSPQLPIPTIRQSLLLNKNTNALTNASIAINVEVAESNSIETSSLPTPTENLPKSPSSSSFEGAISQTSLTKSEELYPGDLNPFGDDEEEYPGDLNPFGDDEESNNDINTSVPSTVKSHTTKKMSYDESMNPFASDDDETSQNIQTPQKTALPISSTPRKISPTGSLRGTLKKRLAPKPPRISDIFPNDSQDSDLSLSSVKSSPAVSHKSFQNSSPTPRKSKPTAPPPPVPKTEIKEIGNVKSGDNSIVNGNETMPKKKKRPAPPVPIPKRLENKKIPLKDIIREMKEIEEKQRECEKQGREIELLIRDKDKDEEASVEEEEYIMQLFELVNQKNALFRRQAELMYIKRSQRLEEQQAEIEIQIRDLLSKPESEKTDEDRAKEEELIMELKDVVDQRSSIIDSIEMDRRREMEEDVSIQEQTEIKNGDLPIAAEMKEKNSGKKVKKEKKKKDKKKKDKNKEESDAKKEKKKRWFPKAEQNS